MKYLSIPKDQRTSEDVKNVCITMVFDIMTSYTCTRTVCFIYAELRHNGNDRKGILTK